MTYKTLFIIFKELLLKEMKIEPLEGENPTLTLKYMT